jgi:nicotinamide-nucleotide amidase
MNTLLIVSNEIIHSPEYIDYIKREIETGCDPLTAELHLREEDNILPLTLQSLTELSTRLFIITSPKSFATAGKILATLNDDSLEAKEELLIPASSDLYDENGYRVTVGECTVNVTRAMFDRELPTLLLHEKKPHLSLNVFGMEADDAAVLLSGFAASSRIRLEHHKHLGGWGVIDMHPDLSGDVNHFLENAQALFSGKVTVADDVVAHIVERLTKLQRKITFAESCTGGLIASLFTQVSGSSAVFDGSMVTYANEIKSGWIGVNATSLMAFGAVSTPVVEEMAAGILEKTGAHYALAVSGVAGPTGGSVEKPVGTVYIAMACRESGVRSERLNLQGDREYIRRTSAFNAIRLLLEHNPELI